MLLNYQTLLPHVALGHSAPLIRCLFRHYIHIVCLFISYASPLVLFPSLFLTYLLPYLSFPLRITYHIRLLETVQPQLRIDPLCFQARCRDRWLNLALVFLCLFCVVVHFFWLVNVCFCCVRFSFTIPSQEIGLEKCLQIGLFCVEWDIKPPPGRETVSYVCV